MMTCFISLQVNSSDHVHTHGMHNLKHFKNVKFVCLAKIDLVKEVLDVISDSDDNSAAGGE